MKHPIEVLAFTLTAFATASVATACNPTIPDGHGHDHGDHDHGDHGHDHGDHGHDHGDHEGHDHSKVETGPNGGRILYITEPHLEFLVLADRNVQISAVNDDGKAIPVTIDSVTVMAGDRANPTQLAFTKKGDVLVSDVALPAGKDFPVVVTAKATPDAKPAVAKFNLTFSD